MYLHVAMQIVFAPMLSLHPTHSVVSSSSFQYLIKNAIYRTQDPENRLWIAKDHTPFPMRHVTSSSKDNILFCERGCFWLRISFLCTWPFGCELTHPPFLWNFLAEATWPILRSAKSFVNAHFSQILVREEKINDLVEGETKGGIKNSWSRSLQLMRFMQMP